MKILYLDLGMGAAGDMLTAALYELLDEDGRRSFIDKANSLGLEGVSVTALPSKKCGICGTHMDVTIDGMTEEEHAHGHHHEHDHHHEHVHEHDHEHEHHGHHHSSMDDIFAVIDSMNVSSGVKDNAKAVYGIIADAESAAHGEPVTSIHFHEVGEKDAVADVVNVCILLEMIGADTIVASPVCTGYGKVRCAHGIMPVPAPAIRMKSPSLPYKVLSLMIGTHLYR